MTLDAPVANARGTVRHASVAVGSLVGSRGVILILQLAVLATLARRLGPAAFGTLQFGVALFTYVGFIADLGLVTVATRRVAGEGSETLRGDLTAARLILAGVALLLVLAVASVAPLGPQERALALVLLIGTLSGVLNFRWLAQGSERFRALAAIDAAAAVVQVLVAVAVVQNPSDLALGGLVMVTPVLVSTALLLLQPGTAQFLRPRLRRSALVLVRAALPLGASAIAIQAYNNADSILLGLTRSVDEVGWYGGAYRIVYATTAVPLAAYTVILPMLSRLVARDSADQRALLDVASRALLAYAVPCAVGLTVTAPLVTSLLFGEAYAPAALPLALLSWVCVTMSANAPFGALMIARGMDRTYFLVTAVGSALNIGANLVVIPLFGMPGAAVVTLVQEVVVLAGFVWVTRDVSLQVLRRSVPRPLAAALVMAIAVLPIRESPAAIPVGVVAYALAATLTKALPTPRQIARLVQREA